MKPVTYFQYEASKELNLAQKTEMLPNSKLITVKLNVTNAGLSDMQNNYDLEIGNPDVTIVQADQKNDGLRHLSIEPLKSRETKLVQMTLKVQDDSDGKYSKALQNKNHPLDISFKLNEFANSPNASVSKSEQQSSSSSPYSLSQSKEKVYNEEKTLSFFADMFDTV